MSIQIKLRNYTPVDSELAHFQLSKPQVSNIVQDIETQLQQLATQDPDFTELNLAPKKENADLKRNIESKLSKLEARTHKAMIEMIKKKIKSQDEGAEESLQTGINKALINQLDSEDED